MEIVRTSWVIALKKFGKKYVTLLHRKLSQNKNPVQALRNRDIWDLENNTTMRCYRIYSGKAKLGFREGV